MSEEDMQTQIDDLRQDLERMETERDEYRDELERLERAVKEAIDYARGVLDILERAI